MLASEALVLALPVRHRLAAKDSILLSVLANDSFIMVPRDTVPIFDDVVVRACRSAGFVPDAPHKADHAGSEGVRRRRPDRGLCPGPPSGDAGAAWCEQSRGDFVRAPNGLVDGLVGGPLVRPTTPQNLTRLGVADLDRPHWRIGEKARVDLKG